MNKGFSGRALWLVILFLVLGAGLFFSNQNKAAEREPGQSEQQDVAPAKENVTPVKVSALKNTAFSGTISVYGKVEARHSAYVSPRVSEIIDELLVDEGDFVEKDKTILFKSENIKLEQKVRNARQNLAIVKATEAERKAYLNKAKVDFDRKEKSFKRYESLFKKQAISQEAFDNVEAAYLSAKAELEQKKAFYNLGLEQAKQAAINLEMAEKDYSDSIMIAPINGFVCERFVDKGEMGQPGKAVFRIEDTSRLDISAFIPAEFSEAFIKDQTCAEVSLYGQKLDEKLKVTFISPIVDAKLHTFEVKCVADSIAAKLKPGQSVQLRFTFNERLALAAPSDALVKDGEGWAVFAPQGSSAHKIPVEKGEEKNGWTEILSPDVTEGMKVINEGQAFLRDRDLIRVIE